MKSDNFFGKNGFSDIDIWKPSYEKISLLTQQTNAVEAIRYLVLKVSFLLRDREIRYSKSVIDFQYPKQISLFCVGPLTNIALAIKTYPEIQENIDEVFIMGGGLRGWNFGTTKIW